MSSFFLLKRSKTQGYKESYFLISPEVIRYLYKIKQIEIKPSFIKIASVNLKINDDLQS